MGSFYCDDTFRGKPIRVPFTWSQIAPTSAHWEQAFSPDGGKTWETNWRMDFARVRRGSCPHGKHHRVHIHLSAPMTHSLWLYFLLVLGIVALPGMDMAYVVSNALAGGVRRAAAAIAGIVVGGMVHVLTAAIGITALLVSCPHLLRLLVLTGATYMGLMGLRFLRVRPAAPAEKARRAIQGASVFRYGAVTCLVNPKAYAFMLAVFPSFLDSEGSALALRAAELSAITAATQIAVYGAAALGALQLRRSIGPGPESQAWMQRAVGLIMVASAAFLAHGWW